VSANTAVPLLEGVTTYRRPTRLELVGAPPTEAFEQLALAHVALLGTASVTALPSVRAYDEVR
jgi:hypothetical protein